MKILLFLVLAVGLAVAGLWLWHLSDRRADRAEWRRLAALQPARPDRFDPAMLEALPPVAQRFFRFAIAPGTPLYPVAEITMRGRFGLGDAQKPDYYDMEAAQILAAPDGFVWQMRARRGPVAISGSDSGSWTRFWLMGVAPVARTGGSADHRRSAFGRLVAEAVFWTPAALLPGPGRHWEDLDATTTRVTVRQGNLEQAVDVTVDPDGRPVQVMLMRWSDANADKTFRLQPFGGTLTDFRRFGGFMLPTRVEAGNFFGTDAYFPFFIAEVSDIRFPAAATP